MSEIRFTLPEPPADSEWCGVCAAYYKAAVIDALGDKVRDVEGDGKTGVVWLTAPDGAKLPPLQLPVMTGNSLMAPVLGTTRACWTHAPAITAQQSRLALGQGPLPPGLTMGRG